jgi:hypothetical protein
MMADAKGKRKWFARIAWILLACAILGTGMVYLALPERACWSLMEEGVPPIPLPADCSLADRSPVGASLESFKAERRERGIAHQSWIECNSVAGVKGWPTSLNMDRRWLPSYVAGTYQWRRIVVVLAQVPSAPQGAQVIAEVCRMPWWKYIRQIRGECDGKFAVWK